MKSDLRNLVTLEENYFAQSLKYATATDLAGTYIVSAGNSMRHHTDGDAGPRRSRAPARGRCARYSWLDAARPAIKEGAPAARRVGARRSRNDVRPAVKGYFTARPPRPRRPELRLLLGRERVL